MFGFDREVCHRLPLADAAFRLLDYVLDDAMLEVPDLLCRRPLLDEDFWEAAHQNLALDRLRLVQSTLRILQRLNHHGFRRKLLCQVARLSGQLHRVCRYKHFAVWCNFCNGWRVR